MMIKGSKILLEADKRMQVSFAPFERHICTHIAKQSLPNVATRINETWHDNHIGCIDLFRPSTAQVWANYRNLYTFDQRIGNAEIAYATGTSPTGPFTSRGYILAPVLGWTTHHSIVEFQGKWYLFYHDATLSGGVTHKRNIKVAELTYNEDDGIEAIDP